MPLPRLSDKINLYDRPLTPPKKVVFLSPPIIFNNPYMWGPLLGHKISPHPELCLLPKRNFSSTPFYFFLSGESSILGSHIFYDPFPRESYKTVKLSKSPNRGPKVHKRFQKIFKAQKVKKVLSYSQKDRRSISKLFSQVLLIISQSVVQSPSNQGMCYKLFFQKKSSLRQASYRIIGSYPS